MEQMAKLELARSMEERQQFEERRTLAQRLRWQKNRYRRWGATIFVVAILWMGGFCDSGREQTAQGSDEVRPVQGSDSRGNARRDCQSCEGKSEGGFETETEGAECGEKSTDQDHQNPRAARQDSREIPAMEEEHHRWGEYRREEASNRSGRDADPSPKPRTRREWGTSSHRSGVRRRGEQDAQEGAGRRQRHLREICHLYVSCRTEECKHAGTDADADRYTGWMSPGNGHPYNSDQILARANGKAESSLHQDQRRKGCRSGAPEKGTIQVPACFWRDKQQNGSSKFLRPGHTARDDSVSREMSNASMADDAGKAGRVPIFGGCAGFAEKCSSPATPGVSNLRDLKERGNYLIGSSCCSQPGIMPLSQDCQQIQTECRGALYPKRGEAKAPGDYSGRRPVPQCRCDVLDQNCDSIGCAKFQGSSCATPVFENQFEETMTSLPYDAGTFVIKGIAEYVWDIRWHISSVALDQFGRWLWDPGAFDCVNHLTLSDLCWKICGRFSGFFLKCLSHLGWVLFLSFGIGCWVSFFRESPTYLSNLRNFFLQRKRLYFWPEWRIDDADVIPLLGAALCKVILLECAEEDETGYGSFGGVHILQYSCWYLFGLIFCWAGITYFRFREECVPKMPARCSRCGKRRLTLHRLPRRSIHWSALFIMAN